MDRNALREKRAETLQILLDEIGRAAKQTPRTEAEILALADAIRAVTGAGDYISTLPSARRVGSEVLAGG